MSASDIQELSLAARAGSPGSGSLLLPLALLVAVGGCGGSPARERRYTPPEAAARRALETALGAWQAGGPVDALDYGGGRARLADSQQASGRRLVRFAVVGEGGAQAGRQFIVRLELDGPHTPQNINYVVIGIEPLWVIRQVDLEMLAHWDHPMDAPPEVAQASRPSEFPEFREHAEPNPVGSRQNP